MVLVVSSNRLILPTSTNQSKKGVQESRLQLQVTNQEIQKSRIAKGTEEDLKTSIDGLRRSIDVMDGSLKKIEKTLSQIQTNFGYVYEVMVRYE